jgi:hypothetical protein
MKYLKHYWISVINGGYCCHENPVEKRHPEVEFSGLDVRFWMHDAEGIDVCLSAVPDSTNVYDIFDTHDDTLKVVQALTEEQFNSVATPMNEASSLSQQAKQETDEAVAADLKQQAGAKHAEAVAALHAL